MTKAEKVQLLAAIDAVQHCMFILSRSTIVYSGLDMFRCTRCGYKTHSVCRPGPEHCRKCMFLNEPEKTTDLLKNWGNT